MSVFVPLFPLVLGLFGAQAEKVEVKLLDFFLNEKSLYLTQMPPTSTTVGLHSSKPGCMR